MEDLKKQHLKYMKEYRKKNKDKINLQKKKYNQKIKNKIMGINTDYNNNVLITMKKFILEL